MAVLEVCAASRESLHAAIEAGAPRVELCMDLASGGVTPPEEWIREAVAAEELRVHVLIRSRAGDFVYSEAEIARMEEQIRMAKRAGADGVVIGALTADGEIDLSACKRWMQAAEGMSVTFHRAFDRCRNPFRALEQIIELGCDRLLTSGQADSAEAGATLIRQLREQAAGRIILLPGAGVNPENAATILRLTGASEIHSSSRPFTSIKTPSSSRPSNSILTSPSFDSSNSLERSSSSPLSVALHSDPATIRQIMNRISNL